MFAGLGRPYFVAGNLKYARWTAFFRKEKRGDLVSTWSSDLPAYVELQVETSAGLQSNWMFEIDWANGPEVAKKPEPTAADASKFRLGEAAAATGTAGQPTRGERPVTRDGPAARPAKPREKPRGGKGGK
jgi:hypothetical protein